MRRADHYAARYSDDGDQESLGDSVSGNGDFCGCGCPRVSAGGRGKSVESAEQVEAETASTLSGTDVGMPAGGPGAAAGGIVVAADSAAELCGGETVPVDS